MDRCLDSELQFASRSKVVCVGGSGGQGLEDLGHFLRALPGNLDASLLVTLHRPVGVPSYLRHILQRHFAGPVVVAEDGAPLVPGTCYIGEPDQHLTLGTGRCAALIPDAEHALRNRTIDALFLSVAEHAGAFGTGVILSGSLSDGSAGLATIHAAGGTVMAVTPSSHFWSDMPRNAIGRVGSLAVVDNVAGLAARFGTGETNPGIPRHEWRDGAPFPLSRVLGPIDGAKRPAEPAGEVGRTKPRSGQTT